MEYRKDKTEVPIAEYDASVSERVVSREFPLLTQTVSFESSDSHMADESSIHASHVTSTPIRDVQSYSSVDNDDVEDVTVHPVLEVVEESENQPTVSSPTSCSHHHSDTRYPDIPTMENASPSLCRNCSKSMLSYIVLLQRFLDNIARDVSHQVDPLAQCFQCVKESLELPPLSLSHHHHDHDNDNNINTNRTVNSFSNNTSTTESAFHQDNRKCETSDDHSPKTLSFKNKHDRHEQIDMEKHERETDRNAFSGTRKEFAGSPLQCTSKNQDQQTGRVDGSPIPTTSSNKNYNNYSQESSQLFSTEQPTSQNFRPSASYEYQSKSNVYTGEKKNPHQQSFQDQRIPQKFQASQSPLSESESHESISIRSNSFMSFDGVHTNDNRTGSSTPQYPPEACADGILSTLHLIEQNCSEWQDKTTVWERIESLKTGTSPASIADEAFVTLARNNSDVFGCLVLGASLLLCGTSKNTCVLVADGVDAAFMAPLSTLFREVLHVRSLDSMGTTKLSLLDQPELGITFGKLNIWRLTQYKKCVFLSSDTMVMQNCDELFSYNELSAVADIGWPDCFNSAVFVYRPSLDTFWKLLEFAEKEGSYDGGDQGLLNSYFNTWSQDIDQKLSFIYNLMANVSYTYTPAFKYFGRSVKVVQFMGPFKPGHVKFYSKSGQIAPSSSVHPTYVQFVYVWINVFRVCVLPAFPQEMRDYASSHDVISVSDTLRFFHVKQDSDMDFPTPPSVRLRPSLSDLQSAPTPILQKLKLPLKTTYVPDHSTLIPPLTPEDSLLNPPLKIQLEQEDEDQSSSDEDVPEMESVDQEERKSENPIPGSVFGDYQGMSAWEQGRMDYEGGASSDTIIERLRYLMQNPEQRK